MRLRLLLIVFLLAFSITLVLAVPVRVLWHQFGSALELPVEPSALHGNLWQGEAFVPWAGDQVQLQWQWLPAALLQGRLAWGLNVQARDTDLETGVGRSWSGWALNASDGVVGLHLMRPVLQRYRAELTGQLWFDSLWLEWPAGQAPSGSGTLTLRNGEFRMDGLSGEGSGSTLPVLAAEVSSNDTGALTLNVANQESGEPLVDASVSTSTASLRVLAGWRDVLERELPGGRTVLLESEWPLPEWAP